MNEQGDIFDRSAGEEEPEEEPTCLEGGDIHCIHYGLAMDEYGNPDNCCYCEETPVFLDTGNDYECNFCGSEGVKGYEYIETVRLVLELEQKWIKDMQTMCNGKHSLASIDQPGYVPGISPNVIGGPGAIPPSCAIHEHLDAREIEIEAHLKQLTQCQDLLSETGKAVMPPWF